MNFSRDKFFRHEQSFMNLTNDIITPIIPNDRLTNDRLNSELETLESPQLFWGHRTLYWAERWEGFNQTVDIRSMNLL